jgi:hypothetical protein
MARDGLSANDPKQTSDEPLTDVIFSFLDCNLAEKAFNLISQIRNRFLDSQ